jgi:uncharacterized membrane protein
MAGNEESLKKRVERLELIVADLRRTFGQQAESLPAKGPDVGAGSRESVSPVTDQDELSFPARPESAFEPPKTTTPLGKASVLPEAMYRSEFWLNKVGIGLLLFGVAFLFKYSVDQGWLTEPVRVGLGCLLGLVLLLAGIHIHDKRRKFSQVLIGGAIATFYLTVFASFQLYHLVAQPVAFACMVAVTLGAFFLSLRNDEAVLALIGAVGGLGTPFLLYTPEGSLPGLIAYTCMVLGGTSAIFFYRGWRSLLWISTIGGWVIFSVACSRDMAALGVADHWVVQAGVLFAWLAFWALPVLREVLWAGNPGKWPEPWPDWLKYRCPALKKFVLRGTAHLLTLITPLFVLVFTAAVWRLPGETFGWIVLGGSLVYGLVFNILRGRGCRTLAYTHAVAALALLTIAFCLLLEGKVLLLTLAAEAAALHLTAHKLDDRVTAICAHVLYAITAIWLAVNLADSSFKPEGRIIFNAQAMTDLAVIAAILGASYVLSSETNWLYRLGAHLAVLGWFLRELSVPDHGQAYVTIAWGVYALALLIPGLRLNSAMLRNTGLATLFLVVGKLFLVDLVFLDPIWRILLFMCFGGVFLVISYYIRVLWKQPAGPVEGSESETGHTLSSER